MQEPESTEILSIDEKNLQGDTLNSLQDILDKAQSESKKIDEIVSSLLKLSESATNSESSIQTVLSSAKEKYSELTEDIKLVESLQTELQKKKDEISSISTQAIAISTQISDTQAVIATKSDHIQKAQEHADKVRSDLDRALTAANQQVTEAEGLKTTIQAANTSTNELFDQTKKIKVLVEADAEKISALCEASEKNSATTKNLADISSEIETRITAYEKKLAELEGQSTAQLAEIVKLLPGATSAGLATSFDQRRQSFLKPQNRWQGLFVGSLIAIIIIAIQGLWHIYYANTPLTYDDIIRLWLARIPVGGALIWLAMYSSRESALAKRLEEDYGYKAAIAASFMGFHQQLNEIGRAAASNEPLSKLCEDTLKTIASPPGRIYDKHKLTVSPTSEITQVVKDAAEIIK